MAKHYAIRKHDNDHGWQIIHRATGLALNPYTGPMARPLRKADAEHISKWCDKHAPTNDRLDAPRMLLDAGWMDLVRTFVDPRHARIGVVRQFPLS